MQIYIIIKQLEYLQTIRAIRSIRLLCKCLIHWLIQNAILYKNYYRDQHLLADEEEEEESNDNN